MADLTPNQITAKRLVDSYRRERWDDQQLREQIVTALETQPATKPKARKTATAAKTKKK